FDRLIRLVADGRIDTKWVEKEVILTTHGFHYSKHWRNMLCKIVGEVFALRVEEAMEVAYPGDLDNLKSMLGQLWTERCKFAHADLASNVAAAVTFNAPSLTISHYNKLKQVLGHYEVVMISVMPPLLTASATAVVTQVAPPVPPPQ